MSLFHELPLVVFTLAVQLAVGSCLALLVVRRMLWAGGEAAAADGMAGGADRYRDGAWAAWSHRPLLLVGVATAVGLAASLLHLGAPLNAVWALTNLGSSWLSREILAGLVFFGLWAVTFQLNRRPAAATRARRVLAPALPPALALAGLLLVWSVAQVYMLPARPVWNSWLTPASFLLTTLLLGTVAMAAYLEARPLPDPVGGESAAPGGARPGLVLLAVGLAAIVAQAAATLYHPVTRELAASATGSALTAGRLALLLVAGLLIMGLLVRPALDPGSAAAARGRGRWIVAMLLLLLASEAVGRMLFYAAGAVDPF